MDHKRILLIFNPKAGRGEFAARLSEVIDLFTRGGGLVTAYPTQRPGDAREAVARWADGCDLVVCAGGDGTLDEVIDALVRLPQKTALGYIPTGTTNDFAASLGLPKDPLEAAGVICAQNLRAIDVGRFGRRHFSYVAAFGLFTDVSYQTSQSAKNMFGQLAYLLEGAKRLTAIDSYSCTVFCDGEEIGGEFIFGMVLNSLSVGGFKLPFEQEIMLDDGQFEVVLLKKPNNIFELQEVIAALLSSKSQTDLLVFRHASRVLVKSTDHLSWTLDGEYGGSGHKVEINTCPRALRMLVPPDVRCLSSPEAE